MNVLFPEQSLVTARVMRSRDPWDGAAPSPSRGVRPLTLDIVLGPADATSASYRVW